jgi:hypothetical protein
LKAFCLSFAALKIIPGVAVDRATASMPKKTGRKPLIQGRRREEMGRPIIADAG